MKCFVLVSLLLGNHIISDTTDIFVSLKIFLCKQCSLKTYFKNHSVVNYFQHLKRIDENIFELNMLVCKVCVSSSRFTL